MKAVIMAGGKGTRLRPLTSHMPKPMVPLLGRPCMEYIIELLKKYGITDIAVTLQFLPEAIKNYFGDGTDFGVNIVYFEESFPLGTAGSVKNCQEFLDERFLVISGDALTDFNLQDAIRFHVAHESVATLVLSKVESPLEYGVVMTDEAGNVTRFLEKPAWSEVFSDTVNTGIYILEPQVLDLLDKDLEYDFSKDLFPKLLTMRKKITGFVADGYWSDIGNLEVYRQAQFDILEGKVAAEIKATAIAPGVYIEEDVRIANGCTLHAPLFIGRGTFIERESKIDSMTIIGKHNVIKEGCVLRKSIIWDHNYIGRKTEMNGTTICNRSFVGDGCQFSQEVVIGDDGRIGSNSNIKTGVKIWPNKIVDNHAIVNTSLIWGAKLTRNLFGSFGIKGIANIDITPDFVSRLASAMGTLAKPGEIVSISCCQHPFSHLLKSSMQSGLNAAGIDTADFGTAIFASAQYGIRNHQTNFGIHICTGPGLEGAVSIEIMDHNGIPIDKGLERKIENAYWQESFIRATPDHLGKNRRYPHIHDEYLSALRCQLAKEHVPTGKFTLVMDVSPLLGQSVQSLLKGNHDLNVLQIHSSNNGSPAELIETVQKTKANLGIRIDERTCDYMVITDGGKIVSDDQMIALHLLFHCRPQHEDTFRLGIPVSAPREMEWLAEQLQAKVVRTKETVKDMMQASTDQLFHPLFDGLYSLVKMIGFLAKKNQSLSEILRELPSFHMDRRAVFCDWKNKGKVMRMMMEEAKGKQVELLDGIKVFDTDGWVLIMPDTDLPNFRVVSQGASVEIATALARTYVERIEKYQTIV